MTNEIHDPYKVGHKLYINLILVSFFMILVSEMVSNCFFLEVIKNLGYGCFASTIVAYLVDIQVTRDKNDKANRVYESVYQDLHHAIRNYIICFARMYVVAFKENEDALDKHTWREWCRILKDEFDRCDDKRKHELVHFLVEQIQYEVGIVREACGHLQPQIQLLELNDVINTNIEDIIRDLTIEFKFYKPELYARWWLSDKSNEENSSYNGGPDDFWNDIEAVNSDLERYISKWSEICYYNTVRFHANDYFWKDLEVCEN